MRENDSLRNWNVKCKQAYLIAEMKYGGTSNTIGSRVLWLDGHMRVSSKWRNREPMRFMYLHAPVFVCVRLKIESGMTWEWINRKLVL